MARSREETNFMRLLFKCEQMAKGTEESHEWRLNVFVASLDKMLTDLKSKESNKPDVDTLSNYSQRLSFLKGVLKVNNVKSPLGKAEALLMCPKGSHIEETTKIHHIKYEATGAQIRKELFDVPNQLKQRRTPFQSDKESVNWLSQKVEETGKSDDLNDVDTVLKYHNNLQEKIANNMLSLAQNIKEQSLIAGTIVRNDAQKVEKSTLLADKNIEDLKVNSDRLQESNKSRWQCFTWILLVAVIVIFINVVLFMKITRKK